MEKEIVLYRTFDSPVEANIVKDVLETNGVPCFLSNEIFSSDKFGSGSHQAECLCRRRGEGRYYFKYDTTS